MKKLLLLGGVAIGYVLGSRAGRGPYSKLDSEVRKFFGRSDVQDGFEKATAVATDKMTTATDVVAEKLPGSGNDNVPQPKQGSDIRMTLGSE